MVQYADQDLRHTLLLFTLILVVRVVIGVACTLVGVLQLRERNDGVLPDGSLLVADALEQGSLEGVVRLVTVYDKAGSAEGRHRRKESLHLLNLAKAVDHQRDKLDASVPCNLVLGLEAAKEESEELRDEARGRTVLVFVIVSVRLTLLEVCEPTAMRQQLRSQVHEARARSEMGGLRTHRTRPQSRRSPR